MHDEPMLPKSPWALTSDQVIEALGLDPARGLSATEVAARLERFGPNILAEFHATSWWTILLRQLRSFVVYLLFAGAALSFALGDHLEGFAILAVIGVNDPTASLPCATR